MSKGDILIKAHKLINGERNGDYGEFKDNVKSMKLILQAMMHREYTDHEIHCFFLGLKLCRNNGKVFTKDTLTDLAGYAGIIEDNQVE